MSTVLERRTMGMLCSSVTACGFDHFNARADASAVALANAFALVPAGSAENEWCGPRRHGRTTGFGFEKKQSVSGFKTVCRVNGQIRVGRKEGSASKGPKAGRGFGPFSAVALPILCAQSALLGGEPTQT